MCFGTPVYTTTQRNELPQFLEDAYKNLTQRATAVTDPSVEYMPYGGQRLAPLTTEQQAARQLAFQGAQSFQPDLQQARGLSSLAVSPITGQDINYFMNPFQQQVTSNVLDEMRRRSDIEGQRTADAAVRAGAFGGARFGVQEAERLRNLRQQQSRTASDLARQNYQQALGAAQSQRAQQLAGGQQFSNLAGQQMNLQRQGISGLQTAGLQGQQQLQRGMDIAYQDFLRQQQFPYTQAATFSNLLSGVPAAQMTTAYSQQPGPSMAQQLAGLGMAGLGAYGAYKGNF